MQFKSEFDAVVKSLDISEGDQALAKAVWLRCEAAQAGKSVQFPVLLEKQLEREDLALSQSDIQVVVSVLKEILSQGETIKVIMKQQMSEVWSQCNPDDKATEPAFDRLNKMKTFYRKYKQFLNRYATIQHKLKKTKSL